MRGVGMICLAVEAARRDNGSVCVSASEACSLARSIDRSREVHHATITS